ncbi:MAG: DinB family protein, partial [Actinomycetota bacterium]|nr:DinB family protein [Actinomycetota bacterium]
ANPIGWLVWHLARGQDDQIAEILEQEQVWISGDWARRFGVAADPANTGYGHSEDDVMAIRPESAEALIEYYEAVATRTHGLLERTTPKDLDRIVDRNWDPPVTLGVRLVSIADDDIQHAGQASYVRGILERR